MWLYDPRTNYLEEKTIDEIAAIYGGVKSTISIAAKKQTPLKRFGGCYVFKDKPNRKTRLLLYEKQEFKGELWKRLDNTNFFISNYGRIKQLDGQFILPFPKRGERFMCVKLRINGEIKPFILRKLVAEHFLGKPSPGSCVTHKTSDYTDCSVWNIEYGIRGELYKKGVIRACGKPVVLVNEHTLQIINGWPSAREAARALHFGRQTITDRCNGVTKTRKGGWFMWEDDYDKMLEQLKSDKVV